LWANDERVLRDLEEEEEAAAEVEEMPLPWW